MLYDILCEFGGGCGLPPRLCFILSSSAEVAELAFETVKLRRHDI